MAQIFLNARSARGMYHILSKKELVTEASTLGLRPGHQWERLYDDACDVGIVLRSHKTGVEIRWYLQDTERDAEGDVTCWKFRPCSESARKNPDIDPREAATLSLFNYVAEYLEFQLEAVAVK